MENYTILICITVLVSLYVVFFSEDDIYKSHKKSPVSGDPTKITVCIQDPYFNNGFIISLASIDELREIQTSLKMADKKYVIIRDNDGDFSLINSMHKREQIIKKCSYKLIKSLMRKNKTSMVDYSV